MNKEIVSDEKVSQEKCPKCNNLLYSKLIDFGEDSFIDGLYLGWYCKNCNYSKMESL